MIIVKYIIHYQLVMADFLQYGHLEFFCNHLSMQEQWNLWPQDNSLTLDPFLYSHKQIQHVKFVVESVFFSLH